MASNFLPLNSSKTEFLLISLFTQLVKIDNPMPSNTSFKPVASARNLGVIFDSNLSLSDHISYISKTCFPPIRDLRRIHNNIYYLDYTTACTFATSHLHSKLDYCNSLFLTLKCQQTNRLQLIPNFTARAVTKTPKYNLS
jgi:hypothetical protein